MRAKTVTKFERGLEPKKAMGTGLGTNWIYNIKSEDDEYNFSADNDAIKKYIKSQIPNISDNEISRFLAFTLQNIYDNIPTMYLEKKDEKAVTDYVRQQIHSESTHWMGMHSDRAMRQISKNSGLNI